MWKTENLGDVVNIQNGNSIPVKEKEALYANAFEGLPYIATKDVGYDRVINYDNGVKIPSQYSSKFRISQAGSTLVCAEGGSAGRKIAFSSNKCHFVNKLFSLYPSSKELDSRFIYYFTLSSEFQNQFKKSMHGLIGGVSLNKIKKFNISFPIISEQQDIISKLDTAFFEINNMKRINKIKFEKNNSLIQNYIDSVYIDNKNLFKLSDCCTIKPSKNDLNNLNEDIEVSFMPMRDLGINNLLVIPNQKRKLKEVKKGYTYFSEGDVLLAKITPCFENGKLGIASNLLNKVGFGSSEYIVFRPNKNLKKEWLYYFLNRQNFRRDGAQNMSGAVGHRRVNKSFIENTLIPIPPLGMQKKILLDLENISNQSKIINKNIKKQENEIISLEKSILNKFLNSQTLEAS